MTTLQDGSPKPAKESEPLITGPESPRRLIVVAFGWLLLAEAVPAAVGFVRGLATGFVRGLTKGASQLEIPPTLRHLLVTVGAFGLGMCFFMPLQSGAVSWVAVTVASGWGLTYHETSDYHWAIDGCCAVCRANRFCRI